MKEIQNLNNNAQNNETETNSLKHKNPQNNPSENNFSYHKPSLPKYYNKNMGQITIKADKELVDSIKQIAMDEARTIQTVTNRLLEKALDLYEEERSHYLK